MNERIRELAEQATKYAHTKNDSLHQFNLDALYEKFAELIVQECINTVENLSPGYDDYRNQIEDAFRGDCVEQIKHHFEIE